MDSTDLRASESNLAEESRSRLRQLAKLQQWSLFEMGRGRPQGERGYEPPLRVSRTLSRSVFVLNGFSSRVSGGASLPPNDVITSL